MEKELESYTLTMAVNMFRRNFEAYLKSKRIFHEMSIPHSPEQNGVAEHMNRTLMESACSMLSHATDIGRKQ